MLAVRLQELFGLIESPAVLGGRVPLTLHLLSPAHRPVQVTQDLVSFWAEGYAEVRRELRGRYPKHHWPRIRSRRPRPAGRNGAPNRRSHRRRATRRSRPCSIRLRAGPRRCRLRPGRRPAREFAGRSRAGGSRRVRCRRRRCRVEMVAVHTGLVEGQHRCHTAVGGLEDGCPLVAGSGREHGSDPFAEFRPSLPVVLRRQVGVGEAQMFEETSVEMPFDRGDRQVLAISALVDGVEGAPPSKRLVPRSGRWKPLAAIPKKVEAIDATPSVMATSTTWPSPERFASHRAHMTP